AMAIAMADSVTVSIADVMIGILSAISRVMRVRTSVSVGSTSDRPGFSSTSSKVSASRRRPFDFVAIAKLLLAQLPGLLVGPGAELARADSTRAQRMKAQSGSSHQKSGIRYRRLGISGANRAAIWLKSVVIPVP